MKTKSPRMVEGRFTFQTVPNGENDDVVQFDVRVFLRDQKLRVSIDLHGEEDALKDLDPAVLGTIDLAIETVKGRVKAGELYEQVE